jgi:hypothetical protein
VRYIYSTFPIVEREETLAYGHYLSRDLCLAWMNALAAGTPDAEIEPQRGCLSGKTHVRTPLLFLK